MGPSSHLAGEGSRSSSPSSASPRTCLTHRQRHAARSTSGSCRSPRKTGNVRQRRQDGSPGRTTRGKAFMQGEKSPLGRKTTHSSGHRPPRTTRPSSRETANGPVRPTAENTRERGASAPTCAEPWKARWVAAPSQWQQRRLLRQEPGPRGRRHGLPGHPGPPCRPPSTRPRPRVRHATRPSPHARAPGRHAHAQCAPRRRGPSAEICHRDARPRIPPRSGARASGKCSSGAALGGAAERGGSEPRLPPGGFGAPGPASRPAPFPGRLPRRPGVPTPRDRCPEDAGRARWSP